MLFPVDSFPGAPQLETRKALLLIDLQNDFASSDGQLHVANVADFLPRLPGLISKFRESGEIVWVQTQFVEPCPTISADLGSYTIVLKAFVGATEEGNFDDEISRPSGDAGLDIDAGAEDPEAFLAPGGFHENDVTRCCLTGTSGSRFAEPLIPSIDHEKDEILIKSQYSAFAGTSLLLTLRKKFVSEIYLCGSLSNISVYATALDAVRHGLSVTIIEDCVGYRDETCHKEAMRQMADGMGAEGVELQELVDDLNGDLGDVVTEDTFPSRFEVRLSDPRRSSNKTQVGPRVQEWIPGMDNVPSNDDHPIIESIESRPERAQRAPSPPSKHTRACSDRAMPSTTTGNENRHQTEPPMSKAEAMREATPTSLSPPRKRSTDLDFEQQDGPKAMYASSRYRASAEPATPTSQPPKPKSNRVRLRKRKPKADAALPGVTGISASSTGKELQPTLGVSTTHNSMPDLGNLDESALPMDASVDAPVHTQSMPDLAIADDGSAGNFMAGEEIPAVAPPTERQSSLGAVQEDIARPFMPKEQAPQSVNPVETRIGEGDSRICHNFLVAQQAMTAFHALRFNSGWQKMYHRSGEVPRLVAVQGEVQPEGSIPIYRHPADESPQCLPFSPTVQSLRECVERELGHPVNHVLMQLYRSGEDNISEHSDKTLDIVRGSSIVNLSLGAQRTMVLRAKKSSNPALAESGQPRVAQRIPLAHNSLFILGQQTNRQWLHAIRPDKRRVEEKSPQELDYGGERISLTFRYIGTFLNPMEGTIWGQGASEKEKKLAKKILSGSEAEQAVDAMIRAFGLENHQSHEFNWEELYGTGFDVVNFVSKEVSGVIGT